MHLYEEIEAYVIDLIHSGKLREGDQIPKEMDLAAQFHASRPTVRQALARLTMNGVITRTKGRGSFVSRKKIAQEYTRFISSYRDELQKKGLTPRTVVTSFEKKKATVSISEKLDLAEDSSVYQLSRLRYIDSDPHKKPVLFTTVYLPCALCSALDSTQFEDASLYATLESQGLFVSHVLREIEIRSASAHIARLLRVKEGEPVFYITSVGKLSDGRPIEYSETYYPSETSKFLVEIER